jgi:hypothetical protein
MFKNTEGHFSFEWEECVCTALPLIWLRSVEVASPSEQKASLQKKNNGKLLIYCDIFLYPRALTNNKLFGFTQNYCIFRLCTSSDILKVCFRNWMFQKCSFL